MACNGIGAEANKTIRYQLPWSRHVVWLASFCETRPSLRKPLHAAYLPTYPSRPPSTKLALGKTYMTVRYVCIYGHGGPAKVL